MEWKQPVRAEDGSVKIPESWIFLRYYEALNVLFRIENALRVFVYIVLKNELKDNWVDAHVRGDDEESTVGALAKKRMGQAKTFGYLGHAIACPVMHLNSGELTRLIVSDAYWTLFKPYFLGSKEIIKNKLDEIGSIRNSLAHFRPIQSDDVDVIKQNSRHVLLGIEQFLNQVLKQHNVIPTNTKDEWYKSLKTLGTNQCAFTFQQSEDEEWIRLSLEYACPIIRKSARGREHLSYTVLSIKSSAVLIQQPEIAQDICYLLEHLSYPQMLKDHDAKFRKTLSLVLSRSMLRAQHQNLKKSLEALLLTVAKETELIQKDHLARGQLVYSATVDTFFLKHNDEGQWRWHNYEKLCTPVVANDLPEYWGNLELLDLGHSVATTNRYPWMPEAISTEEVPF